VILISFREYIDARLAPSAPHKKEPGGLPKTAPVSSNRPTSRSTAPELSLSHFALAFAEGDEGLQAFIGSQNASFKVFLRKLLDAKKITDPRLVQEAESLIADRANHLFNYGEELVRIASAGRGRLRGADALQGATEAAGRMWELLWRPEAYARAQTWESRFPMSSQRGGIQGTVRAVANNLIGHFAQRLRKGRARVSTLHQSQIEDPDHPIDFAGRASNEAGEWEQWRDAIIRELVHDLHDELARNRGGKHWEARIRNLRLAIAVVEKQMEIPYEPHSMSDVMRQIPELRGVGRGGLQQALKTLINDARNRAVDKMGSKKEQGVAHWLRTRGRRTWERTRAEGALLPVILPSRLLVEPSSPPVGMTPGGFGEYVGAQEALLSPSKPVQAAINPFPGMGKQVQQLFPRMHPPAKAGSPTRPPSPPSPRTAA